MHEENLNNNHQHHSLYCNGIYWLYSGNIIRKITEGKDEGKNQG